MVRRSRPFRQGRRLVAGDRTGLARPPTSRSGQADIAARLPAGVCQGIRRGRLPADQFKSSTSLASLLPSDAGKPTGGFDRLSGTMGTACDGHVENHRVQRFDHRRRWRTSSGVHIESTAGAAGPLRPVPPIRPTRRRLAIDDAAGGASSERPDHQGELGRRFGGGGTRIAAAERIIAMGHPRPWGVRHIGPATATLVATRPAVD